MQLLSSLVEDENRVVTVKTLAYELNVPLVHAQQIMEDYYKERSTTLSATWILIGPRKVILSTTEQVGELSTGLERVVSKSIYSIEKNQQNSGAIGDALGSAIEEGRKRLISEDPTERLLNNKFGVVRLENVKILPHASKPVFAAVEESEEEERPKPATKSAANFFRNSSVTSQSSTGSTSSNKKSEPIATKQTTTTSASSTAKTNFFGVTKSTNKVSNETEVVEVSKSTDEGETTAKRDSPVPQQPSITKRAKLEMSPSSEIVGKKRAAAVVDSESDEDSSSDSSSSSSEDSDDDLEEELVVALGKTSTQSQRKSPSAGDGEKKKRSSKVTLADGEQPKPKKKRRVVESDDEDDAKVEARRLRKEQRKAERDVERQAEKEAKHRRELEEAESSKRDFLKHMGANESRPAVVKKKVLKTKTFVDEDGFEVTEDVMEEIEVLEEVEPVTVVAPPKPSIAIKDKLKPTAAVSTTGKAVPAGTEKRQASLTSFFSKIAKE